MADNALMLRHILYALALAATAAHGQSPAVSDWGHYGGDSFGQRYSPLHEINRDNVAKLEVAWTYRTGELGAGFARADKLAFEATPVLAFGRLYLSTPTSIVIALDPATGRELWRHDPHIPRDRHYAEATSRGVAAWEDPDRNRKGACIRRVFLGTLDARLLALDADSGKPCADFGLDGAVQLGVDARLTTPGEYLVTSPPAIFEDVVIVGSAIGDNRGVELERGIVRGFDARSGATLWKFDPIPDSKDHPTASHWRADQAQRTGGANAWAPITVDPGRGLAFIPTGSASPDFYGGERQGDNAMANSLVALDARTGAVRWYRQLIHHDLWDFDLAAQPTLIEIESEARSVAAVVQATKSGLLFVLDRETGEPVYGIEERKVPASRVPGEQASPTQPFPKTPPLVSPGPIRPQDAWGLTFWDRGKCRELIAKYRNEGAYTPPDLAGTILFPSFVGGVNWGGVAHDLRSNRIIAVVNHFPFVVTLAPRETLRIQRESGGFPESEFAAQRGTPYGARREPLVSPWGLPCVRPPWGTLVSVDLGKNRIDWEVPLGGTRGILPAWLPSRDFGMPGLGGAIVTAGDLVFVAAAMDNRFRAFDVETGKELWKRALPAGGQATPMTYRAGPDHRQFVVIAAGGHGGLDTPKGDYVIAYALPR
ncbi:MAG: Quinoprotein glucose dehydrogenase [Steroidobacteraceae bacterium]|nr:Quinoprotein glucose dehydrogenase [Steroidobacteraceae bacterium]